MFKLLLLLLYVGFALGISFLCSLLEAALLSSRNATLTEHKLEGSKGAGMLLVLKQTRIDDAISAILILNTVSNTLGATMAGARAAEVFGSAWIGLFSGILTFLILVVSEIIPKTLGATYWSGMSGFVGYTLTGLVRIMAPFLLMSRMLTRFLTRDKQPGFSRGELKAVIDTASRDGAISADESILLANLLKFEKVRVEDVMTPRTVTFMMPAGATIEDLLSRTEAEPYSRIPLYHGQEDDVVGYVLLRDVLKHVASGGSRKQALESLMRSIWFIPEIVTVGAALKQFLKRREAIAMVADEHGSLAGLVTMEDLTETILGAEIVDEFDRIVDLRQAATELRDRRLDRLRKKHALATGPADSGDRDEGSFA